MAYSAVSLAGDSGLSLVEFLKVYQLNGTYYQINTHAEWWKYFLKQRVDAAAKNIKFSLTTSTGAAAVQSIAPGTSTAYPTGQYSTGVEGSAQIKLFAETVLVPHDVLHLRGDELRQYIDPIAKELDDKKMARQQVMSHQMMGDGSGAIGKILDTSVASGTLTITLDTTDSAADRSHVDWFIEKDKIKFASSAGTAQAVTVSSGTISYYLVDSFDIQNDTVAVKAYDSSDTLLTITAANQVGTGDYVYRNGTTPQDLDSISTNDYNTLSECMVGLPSLCANDGRKVHGITLSGSQGGSVYDADSTLIDHNVWQKALSFWKRRNSGQPMTLKDAWMHSNTLDAMVEANETDRRFGEIKDGTRGFAVMGYRHGNTVIRFQDDRYVPYQRIYLIPEEKDVLKVFGKDFMWVDPNKGLVDTPAFHPTYNSSGQRTRQSEASAEGGAVAICLQPRKILQIRDFVTSAS